MSNDRIDNAPPAIVERVEKLFSEWISKRFPMGDPHGMSGDDICHMRHEMRAAFREGFCRGKEK